MPPLHLLGGSRVKEFARSAILEDLLLIWIKVLHLLLIWIKASDMTLLFLLILVFGLQIRKATLVARNTTTIKP